MDEVLTTLIEGVELCSTGEWPFSTGKRWLTQEHLKDAIAAQEDPALRTPKIKIGHTDPRFDGQPLFGSVVNLRLSENGQTLLGDYVIAQSIAPLVAKGPDDEGEAPYAKRSIEGAFDVKTETGNEYSFILTAVALLGETDPAISDIEDVVGVFIEGEFIAAASSKDPEEGKKLLRAGAVVDKIRMDIWSEVPADDMPWGDWSWVRRVEVDSGSKGFLIVEDDDTAKLYKVPWEIKGDDVTYGEASEVMEQYVAASADTNAIGFSRNNRKVSGKPVTLSATAPGTTAQSSTEKGEMDLAQKVREKLGLAEDADEATVEAALEALETPKPEDADADDASNDDDADGSDDGDDADAEGRLAAGKLPEGVVAIDKQTLDTLKASASRADALIEKQRVKDRDDYLGEAIKAGKFPPSRKEHYAAMYDKDEKGTKEFVDKLAAGTIPMEERGHAESDELQASGVPDYPDSWLTPAERERLMAGRKED